jgi:hypothetical protein
MALSTWVRAAPRRGKSDKRTFQRRLHLGVLEDRTVPSAFTVLNTLDDVSVGSLRWAVAQANSNPGADTIDFESGVFSTPQTIGLSGAQLELSDTTGAISIAGPKAGVTVRGGGDTRVFQVDALVTASIAEMTITNGFAGNGGGLSNSGSLTMTNCTVSGNFAGSGGGGGVANAGTATLTQCTFSGNSTQYGAGLSNSGSLAMTHCTVSGNSTNYEYSNGGAGGGVINFGTATLTNCTVSGNGAGHGGGVANVGTATLLNCTVSGNSAFRINDHGHGGGVSNYGSLAMVNSTVSGNSASASGFTYYGRYGSSGYGGGVYNSGSLAMTNCTVSGNSATGFYFNGYGFGFGGGIYVGTASAQNATNTIVAGNQASFGMDISGGLSTNLNNLINMSASAAGLGTLGNNGGPTQTIPLLPGSPAINAGTSVGAPLIDQRGLPRFGPVDIGAYEKQAAPIVLSTMINDGSAQRSRVSSVTVMFDSAVSFASTVANAFTLTRTGGGTVSFSATASVVNGVTVVTLNNFTGGETQFGSLADGRYKLTAIASQIGAGGQQLDGNYDGLGGGNYTFGDAQGLFRFFGDINGDRHVDIVDFRLFSSSIFSPGNYIAAFDFNGDGHIDIADFGQFSIRVFTVLP